VAKNENETRVFDATSGKPLSPVLKASFLARHPPRAMFSPDGSSLLIMAESGVTRIFAIPDGKLRKTLPPPSPPLKEFPDTCVQAVFSSDGKACFLISASGVVQKYDSKSWKPSGPKLEHPHWNGYSFGLAVSDDLRWIATTDAPGENGPRSYLQLWDGRTGKRHGPSLEAQNGWTARFSGGLLFATPGRGTGRVIDPASGSQLFSIPQHDDVEGPSISLSPDGRSLLSFGYDGLLLLHDAMNGERKGRALQPRPGAVRWAPDSSHLYVLADETPLGMRDSPKFSIVKLKAPELEVSGQFHLTEYPHWMELSPDGTRLLVCQGRTDSESLVILETTTLTQVKKG
jgi:WD40 repeat protein